MVLHMYVMNDDSNDILDNCYVILISTMYFNKLEDILVIFLETIVLTQGNSYN